MGMIRRQRNCVYNKYGDDAAQTVRQRLSTRYNVCAVRTTIQRGGRMI